MKTRTSLLLLLIAMAISLLAAAGPASATVYYLDASGGNDANSGTSSGSPWKTLAKVNATSLQPGDQVLLKRGETWRQTLVLSASGTAASPITIDAYGTGDNPVISGADRLTQWAAVGSAYYKNLVAAPAFVYYGNNRLTKNPGAKSQVGVNQWDWDANNGNNTLWVNVGDDPDNGTLEVNSRNLCVYSGGSNYIVLQNLTLEKARQQMLQVSNSSNWTVRKVLVRNGIDTSFTGARGVFFLNSPNMLVDSIELYGTYGDSGVQFNTCNNSAVVNSSIHNHQGDGIYVGNSAGINVSNNTLYGQMGATSDNIQFNKCTNYKIVGNDTDLKGSDTQKGNIIATQGSGGLIQGNKCGYGAYGVSCSDSNSVVESNIVHDHATLSWHSGLYMSAGFANDGITWRYNISYDDNNGFLADTSGGDPHTNITIYKNTFYNSKLRGAYFDNISGVFANNILWAPDSTSRVLTLVTVASGGTWSSNYNDIGPEKSDFVYFKGPTYSTLSGYAAATSMDKNSFSKDPLFVDAANHDFRLQPGSPCIGTGTTTYGVATPNGVNNDIGAVRFMRLSAPGSLKVTQ